MSDQPGKHDDLVLEIIRETGKDANWLNRFCQNVDNHVDHLQTPKITSVED
jgi:hypothetical protein